jgi:amino acid adenylation domain-containing protein
MMEFQSLGTRIACASSKWPNRVAVKGREKQISYSELDAHTSSLASFLLAEGFGRGTRVGIYLDKSIESVVSLIAALKSGAAYVPLDVTSPVDRTRYIVDNCQLSVLILEQKYFEKIESILDQCPFLKCVVLIGEYDGSNPRVLEKLKNWKSIQNQSAPSDFSQVAISPDDTAYILYTSGSTGQPKGVTLSHRNAIDYVDWIIQYLKISEQDVLSSHAPFHFDLSILDIFASLFTGAQLVLVPSGISYFPSSIVDFIANNKISIWYSVPSILVQLSQLPNLNSEKLSSLRVLIYAGEVFQFQYLNVLRRSLKGISVLNLYGPTETNVITYYEVDANAGELTENVPIGRPCPYTDIQIIDQSLVPVKRGQEGELIVRSTTLMSGYWADQEKTNRAIRNVTINEISQPYYFTGDLVVEMDDGNLVYKGRRDHMIKSRGFRIELGEIETALSKHPLVKEAVALAIPDPQISNRIVAVVAVKVNSDITEEDLKDHCMSSLPTYMVPETIVQKDSLPKTSNGKIARQELFKLFKP